MPNFLKANIVKNLVNLIFVLFRLSFCQRLSFMTKVALRCWLTLTSVWEVAWPRKSFLEPMKLPQVKFPHLYSIVKVL